MKIKRGILVVFLGLILIPLTCVGGYAELNLGASNYTLDGYVELGGGWLSSSPRYYNRTYLQQYVPFPQGFLAYTDVAVKSKDGLEYYKFYMYQPGLTDQNYLLQAGKLGVYHAEIEYDELQHLYCGVNPFISHGLGVGILVQRVRASGWVSPTPEITLFAEDNFLRRTGTQGGVLNAGPGSGGYAFTATTNTLHPVNYKQNDLKVGAEFDHVQYQFRAAYNLSTFDNGDEAIDARRNTNTGALSRAVVSLPPSNYASSITAEGALNLLDYKTRLQGSMTYGWLTQDSTVFNGSDIAANAAAKTPLVPAGVSFGNAGLGATTFAGYFSGVTRPNNQWTFRYGYNAYNYENGNLGNAILTRAFSGTLTPLLSIEQYSYLRQTVNLGVDYKVNSQVALNIGYGWQGWNRTDGQGSTSTNSGMAGIRWFPTDWLNLIANYSYASRVGNNYLDFVNEAAGEAPLTYKMYEGSLSRNKMNFVAEVTPANNVTCSVNCSFINDTYHNSSYGMQNDQGWSAGADVSWRPTDRVAFSLGYDHQQFNTKALALGDATRVVTLFGETAQVGGDTGPTLLTSDSYDTISLRGDFKLIPDKLSNTTRVNYSYSNSNFHNPLIPNLNQNYLNLNTFFTYKFNEHWACRAGYIFEYFNTTHAYQRLYQQGITNTGLATNQSFNTLDQFYQNASAHIVQGFIQYKF